MKMDPSIRVRTERVYKNLYNQLRNVAVGDNHELFFICACLGYRRGLSKAIGSKSDDRFWSGTIQPEEWCCYYAMILDENDMDFGRIKDDKQVIARIEEYANAGMEVLIEECLDDFLIAAEGEPTIDRAMMKDLPKTLMHYIHEESTRES